MGTNIPDDYEGLLRQYRELENMSFYKKNIGNRFIERMHYDFNTLLNSITGYIYSVYETADSTQKPAIDGALRTSKTLMNKFNDMTDYLSLLMDGYSLDKSPSSMRQLLRQVNQEFDEDLSAKGLHFACEIDEKIPEYIETDGVIVKKAVAALVENAIHNTVSGTVKVSASLISESKPDLKILFSVSDEGRGIDVEKISSLFNGAAIEDASASKGWLGGFGLQRAKDFLEKVGSSLTVENNSDKGASFSFVLEAAIVSFDVPSALEPESGVDEKKALPGARILFADDSVIIQQIIMQILGEEDAEITVASNGGEAVSLYTNNKYDIILMDIEMPIMNGYEATRKIKELEDERGVITPIIGMTAHTKQEEYEKCIESGMSGVVIKPFNKKGLIDSIYKELYHREYVDSSEETLTEKASVYNFESIKGIDYKEGLKRLSGNEKVYFELLQNFRDGYSDTAENISTLLMEGNDNEVKNLLHLIKGISGNLSFNEVYDYANKLHESVIDDNLADITKYLKLFGAAMDEFKTSFKAAEVEILYNTSALEDMDLLLVKTRLKELLDYLSGDVDLGNAVDACDDIYDYMTETDNRKDFGRIRDALNSFDLELAVALLKSFITRFS